MANITVLKNTPYPIYLQNDFVDTGWSIQNGIAYHGSCNAGIIRNISIPIEAGESYYIEYEIVDYSSGSVNVIVGATNGESRTENGIFKETIIATDNSNIKFYSNGQLAIKSLKISNGNTGGITVAFSEKDNRWVTYLSYIPDFMTKFIDDYYTWYNGTLWKHNSNEIRNNFYGTQYNSKITFYANINPTEVKTFYSMRQKSNKVWNMPEAITLPLYGKESGQKTRLSKSRFQNLNGDWFAAFLKDMNDPRFSTELDALFKGADIQGNVLEITIENDDTVEVRLLSIDVEAARQNYTY